MCYSIIRIDGDKMNKKGFTTIEVVLSFALVVIILASLTGIIVNYRDKVTDEEVKTQLWDYKNTITKVVYDDIVQNEYIGISRCTNDPLCVNFIKNDQTTETLKVINQTNDINGLKRGIYIEYKNIKYMLPDSDLNQSTDDEEKYMSTIKDFNIKTDNVNNLYSVKIPFYHKGMDYNLSIDLVVS